MPELAQVVEKVRSKNAGPFWLTIDIFCGTADAYERVRDDLSTGTVAKVLDVSPNRLKRFDIAALNVVKFSLPRPSVQGTLTDRDMHGASFAELLNTLQLPERT